MDISRYSKSKKEYMQMLRYFVYLPLKLTGFCRFDIRNNEIVKLTRGTVIFNVILMIMGNCCVGFLLYSSIYTSDFLKLPDGLCIAHFALFSNIVLLNLTFPDRHSGLELIEKCIKIDAFLGVKETRFTRTVSVRSFIALHGVVTFTNIVGGILLYMVYINVSMSIHIVGSLYFFWLIFAYDDYVFCLMFAIKNAMTIRHLNGALIKLGNMHEEYLPSKSFFYVFFWNKNFDKLINFHKRASIEEFNRAFRMCFDILYTMERFYSFPLLYGVGTVFVGTFIAVQTFIMRVKNTTAMEKEQTYFIVSWALLSWGFFMLMAVITDMFAQQIQQTKLICTYIQLKPNQPAVIYKLTKSVLRTLENRHVVPYVMGMFYYDTGFIFGLAASTLVYITVQLQLAFPKKPLSNYKYNDTYIM